MKKKFNKSLNDTKNITYSEYQSPIGSIFIFSDTYSIRSIFFSKNIKSANYIKKTFKSKNTSKTIEIKTFLKVFFSNSNNSDFPENVTQKGNYIFITDNNTFNKNSRITLDLSNFTENEIMVYNSLLKIKFGKIESYESLSEKTGFSSAARFIGNTMAKNIFPILIPCHRIIKSSGIIGNYSGGNDIKKILLNHEGHSIKNDKIIA